MGLLQKTFRKGRLTQVNIRMDARIKGLLHLIVNLALNGTIFAVVPADYKTWAVLVVNLAQVVLAFLDPSYTIQKLGMSKQEYLGKIQ